MRQHFLAVSTAFALLGSVQLQASITATSDDFSTKTATFSNWTSVGPTNTVIQYHSPNLYDYDVNNLIPGDTTQEATGDGVKGDGSLKFETQNSIPGDEAIGLTLGGTMALGEQYNFSMGVFNDNASYWSGSIQLYNLTTGTVLAQTAAASVNGYTSASYVPETWILSYAAQAADVGDQLQIRVVENADSAARDGFIDNFSLNVGAATTNEPPPPPGNLYPQGSRFSFTFYSTINADALDTLTNGATATGPYYGNQAQNGGQATPLANAIAWNTKLIYKVYPPSIGFLSSTDFDAPGFVWPSDATISNEVATIVSAVQTNAQIAFWDVSPEELRYYKTNEVNALRVIYSAIHANDPTNRPVYDYQANNRTAAELGVMVSNEDICLKGSYVNTVTDDQGGSCMTNRIWARWSMEQEVQACALYNTNAIPWIDDYMATNPPAGTTADTITNWCRHDAYMGLIMGGKGIHIWSGFRNRAGFTSPWFDDYLGGYLTVGNDLNGLLNLAPVFLFGQTQSNATMNITAGPATQTLYYASTTNIYPSITYRVIIYNGTNYLFMVNSAQQSVTAIFSGLPDTSRLDLFADTNAATPGGTFAITLPALGVSALRFAPMFPPVFLTDPFSLPTATIGSAYSNSIAGSATDPNGDPLIFSKISGPAWLNVATNGVITGTPGYADFGTNSFTVQAADSSEAANTNTATLLISVSSPNCGPTVVLSENFAGETIATLAGQGWMFSGQGGAELVSSTANSSYLGTINYLRVGSNTVSQPFAQKSFGAVTNGQFQAITFTTSSYCNAGVKLLDASSNILLAFYLPTPTSLAVSNIAPVFPQTTMSHGATHNLLSSSSPPLEFDELTVTWGGSNVTWQVVNRNATNGAVIYDTGLQTATFTVTGVPSQLRLDTGTYNNSARYFGTTDIQVMDTTGCSSVGGQPMISPGLDAAGGSFNFQFTGTTGQHYQVEYTPVLPAPGPWQVVTDIVSLATSPFSVSQPMTNSQGFYRVVLIP